MLNESQVRDSYRSVIHCVSKNVDNFTFKYLSQKSTDFSSFWCKKNPVLMQKILSKLCI